MRDIIKAGKSVSICTMDDEAKDEYRNMQINRSLIKSMFNDKNFNRTWAELLDDSFVCSIIENSTGKICGFVQMMDKESKTPEIGIDIIDGYMSQGYGYESTKLLIEYYTDNFEIDYFRWKADTTNKVSCAIAKKQGGIMVKEKPFMPQKVIDTCISNGYMTEEDISYVYIYHIYPRKNVNR